MLAVNKLVLFIIFLAVLAAAIILLVLIGNPIAEGLVLQNQVRMCCGAYRGADCDFGKIGSICCGTITDPVLGICKGEYLGTIVVTKLKMEEWQLNDICNCK
jgi:hypothetical protein